MKNTYLLSCSILCTLAICLPHAAQAQEIYPKVYYHPQQTHTPTLRHKVQQYIASLAHKHEATSFDSLSSLPIKPTPLTPRTAESFKLDPTENHLAFEQTRLAAILKEEAALLSADVPTTEIMAIQESPLKPISAVESLPSDEAQPAIVITNSPPNPILIEASSSEPLPSPQKNSSLSDSDPLKLGSVAELSPGLDAWIPVNEEETLAVSVPTPQSNTLPETQALEEPLSNALSLDEIHRTVSEYSEPAQTTELLPLSQSQMEKSFAEETLDQATKGSYKAPPLAVLFIDDGTQSFKWYALTAIHRGLYKNPDMEFDIVEYSNDEDSSSAKEVEKILLDQGIETSKLHVKHIAADDKRPRVQIHKAEF